MNGDTELLRRYVEDRSEAAFAELVRLHLNLVYFAALRQVGGDAHRAEEVAQSVFTDLARKARSLTGRATLTGWLHTSTRFAATKVRRADSTRQHHEQEATTMNVLLSDPNPTAEWERLRPMIDDVIHELDERDREAVLLRYFENRPFAEIGAALRLSEDAARMRVDRALDKLRAALARRGVKSTSAALAAAFANQVAANAPAGLATSISGAALASAGAGGLAVAGVGIFMSMKTPVILGAVALSAFVATYLEWNHAFRAESEAAALAVDRDGLRAQLQAEQQRAERSSRDLAALQRDVEAMKAKQAALVVVQNAARPVPPKPAGSAMTLASQQRAVLNNLRMLKAAIDQFYLENHRAPASIDEIVGEKQYVRQLQSVNGESYANVSLVPSQPLVVTMADGRQVIYDSTGRTTTTPELVSTSEMQRVAQLQAKLEPALRAAMEAYRAANNGASPKNADSLGVLIPYFSTPQEGADFVELLEAMKEAQAGKVGGK